VETPLSEEGAGLQGTQGLYWKESSRELVVVLEEMEVVEVQARGDRQALSWGSSEWSLQLLSLSRP